MKQVFKIVCLLLAVTMCGSAYAQNFRVGIKAGAGESMLPVKAMLGNESLTTLLSKAGFQLGITGDYGVNENFSVQPQLLLVTKGGKVNASIPVHSVKLVQLELPIYLLYRHEGFFMGAGPCFNYGLSAKSVFSGAPEVDMYKDTSAGLRGVKFKRFEMGASALLGYEFSSGFLISVHYTKGLTNISTIPNLIDAKNRMYGISIGYFFRPRKAIIVKK